MTMHDVVETAAQQICPKQSVCLDGAGRFFACTPCRTQARAVLIAGLRAEISDPDMNRGALPALRLLAEALEKEGEG